MSLLIGAFTIGAILSLLALGVFVSFRVFDFPDITADGSVTLGAAVAATLLVAQVHPVLATAIACAAGAVAGATTGVIHTRFGINKLLSGILVMTALYSVNLHVMGKSNVPLLSERTLATMAESAGTTALGAARLNLAGWEVSTRDVSVLVLALLAATLAAVILFVFFRTHLGTTMQAAGDNAQMIRALGVNVNTMVVLGLALSNAMVALAGALLAQYQGFADVQMGIGMVVWGLASVIIGEALVGTRQLGFIITGAVMGSVLFRLLVAIALRGGLNPNNLKLITAVFVFVALVLPTMVSRVAGRGVESHQAPGPDSGTMLDIRKIFKTFNAATANELRALQGIDLSVDEGSFVIVVGTNGSGKSTLLNAIAGTFPVDAGTIRIDGVDVTAWPEHRRASLVGRVFQNPFSGTAPSMTIAENLVLATWRGRGRGLGWALTGRTRGELRDRVRWLNMGLEDRLDNPIGSLSGGQRQALTLLMASWVKPKLLLLDEHTAALDPKSADQVIRLSQEIVSRDKLTTLAVTHSMTQVTHLGDRVVMMHRGRVIHDFRDAEKRRLRVDDLLARFEEVRRAEQIDETAAEMLRQMYA